MTVSDTPLDQEARTHKVAVWKRFPWYGYLAIAINIAAWCGSWRTDFPLLQRYSFFPLWLSFILVLDALNIARTSSSPMTRAPAKFAQTFLFSAAIWWLFEGLNAPVQEWHYVSDFSYPLGNPGAVLLATLNFTIVLPVVLEMTELLCSYRSLRPRLPGQEIGQRIAPFTGASLILVGALFLVLPFLFPRPAFMLIWLSLGFLLDPLNNLLGRKSALAHLKAHDWRFFVTLPLSALTCGFFWEMWNYYSLPKWFYTVPYIGFGKIFEMPILGYTGYLPFGIELFALYQFFLMLSGQRDDALTF